MSVLIPQNKVFAYLHNGVRKAAFNRTCDSLYSHRVYQHFKNKDIDKESFRLIQSWMNLNVRSYLERYEGKKEFSLKYKQEPKEKPLLACQLLKYAQCISYNIEVEPEDMSDQERKDFELLTEWQHDLKSAIIDQLEEYKAAAWCD